MLTVVTHTRFDRPELLERTKRSVETALVPGVEHQIIECHENWGAARYAATKLNEYIVFVDDDDTIHPKSLEIMLKAAKAVKTGIVVSDEVLVRLDGSEIRRSVGTKTYGGIGVHPCVAHHMCLIRSDAVDHSGLALHNKYGVGADWLIKASAARVHDATYVPICAYNWTQHEGMMNVAEKRQFAANMYQLGQDLRARWPRLDSKLPCWEL